MGLSVRQQTDANTRVLTEPPSLIKRFTYHSNGQPEYMGWAVPGTATSAAGWLITKITYNASNQHTTTLFADGNNEFDNVWDDRTTGYTYS